MQSKDSYDPQDLQAAEALPWADDYATLVSKNFTKLKCHNLDSLPCTECTWWQPLDIMDLEPDEYVSKERSRPNTGNHFPPSRKEYEDFKWTPFMHHILRYTFMGYGFGCWERVALQLQEYDVTAPKVHQYVHLWTGLSSFVFYMGKHIDIDDVSGWVETRINKLAFKPRFYVDPQLMFLEFTTLPAKLVHSKLSMAVDDRFNLRADEIALAIGFFEKREVKATEIVMARPRKVDDVTKQKTIFTFLDYRYDNGHRGVYPLDTNSAGVLRRKCGEYQVGLNALDSFGNPVSDPEANYWKDDMARMNIIDKSFERAYKGEFSYKRQRVDPQVVPAAQSAAPVQQPVAVQVKTTTLELAPHKIDEIVYTCIQYRMKLDYWSKYRDPGPLPARFRLNPVMTTSDGVRYGVEVVLAEIKPGQNSNLPNAK